MESRSYPLTELLRKVADKGEIARQGLVAWGIDVPIDDRITQAVVLLRGAANTGSIPPAPDGVAPVLRAAWVAADFADIASFLPTKPVKSVRLELGIACKGELWPSRGARQPLQLESQHWIAAIASKAGATIEYAYASSKRQIKIPEFFVRHGAERIAVEVKRPESEKRVAASVDDCRAKFADHEDCWGAIILELTDCVMPARLDQLQAKASDLFRDAHNAVWDGDKALPRPGFERVVYLGAVYRGAWAIAGPTAPRLQLIGNAMHHGYGGISASKQDQVSLWFQEQANRWYDGVITRMDQ